MIAAKVTIVDQNILDVVAALMNVNDSTHSRRAGRLLAYHVWVKILSLETRMIAVEAEVVVVIHSIAIPMICKELPERVAIHSNKKLQQTRNISSRHKLSIIKTARLEVTGMKGVVGTLQRQKLLIMVMEAIDLLAGGMISCL